MAPSVMTHAEVTSFQTNLARGIERTGAKLTTFQVNADQTRRFTLTAKPTMVVGPLHDVPPKQLEGINYADQTTDHERRNELMEELRGRSASMDSSFGEVDEGLSRQALIERDITAGEVGKFNDLVTQVKNQMQAQLKKSYGYFIGAIAIRLGWGSENAAVAKIAKTAVHATLLSDSQQAHQLATFQNLLEFVNKVSTSEEGVNLLSDWHGNQYQHYICEGKNGDWAKGSKAKSPRRAIDLVMERVCNELNKDNKLSVQTMRDMSALCTQIAKQFKPQTLALVKLENMLSLIAHNETLDSQILTNMKNELKSLCNNEFSSDNIKINIQQMRQDHGLLNETTLAAINEAYAVLNAPGALEELDASQIRYPLRGAANWDANRVMPNEKIRTAIAAQGPDFMVKNANATYSRVLPEGMDSDVLTNAQYPKSGFGPSLTTWNTTQFLDVVLGVSDEQKKVYAAGQASDWAANNASYSQKYGWQGAHELSEPFLSYALSSSGGVENFLLSDARAETSQKYMQTTFIRTILKMNMEVQDAEGNQSWRLITHPRTKDDL